MTELRSGAHFSVRIAGPALWITFERPAKLNALDPADFEGLIQSIDARPPQTKAVVFTGSGDRSFSAGMDVATFIGLDVTTARNFISDLRRFLETVRTLPIPAIAAVNGYCIGAAFELALACDIRIAVRGARFGLPEIKVGIPSVLDAALLQQYVGLSLAKEMILSGELYPLERFAASGLINEVVDGQAELSPAVTAMIERVASHSGNVLASQKRLFEIWQNEPLERAISASVDEFADVFAHPETAATIERYRAAMRG